MLFNVRTEIKCIIEHLWWLLLNFASSSLNTPLWGWLQVTSCELHQECKLWIILVKNCELQACEFCKLFKSNFFYRTNPGDCFWAQDCNKISVLVFPVLNYISCSLCQHWALSVVMYYQPETPSPKWTEPKANGNLITKIILLYPAPANFILIPSTIPCIYI